VQEIKGINYYIDEYGQSGGDRQMGIEWGGDVCDTGVWYISTLFQKITFLEKVRPKKHFWKKCGKNTLFQKKCGKNTL
jgi:hypothetical protein